MKSVNSFQFLIKQFENIEINHIVNCHELKSKIFKRFVLFRLKIFNKRQKSFLAKRYEGKIMTMYSHFK